MVGVVRKLLMAGAFCSAVAGCCPVITAVPSRDVKPLENVNIQRNIGYVMLDIERECGIEVPKSCYETLEKMVLKASQEVHEGMDPLIRMVKRSHIINWDFGFDYQRQVLFSEALKT